MFNINIQPVYKSDIINKELLGKVKNVIDTIKYCKELDCIESEINKYKKAYGNKDQTIMLEYISNKMLKSYLNYLFLKKLRIVIHEYF